MAYTDIDDPTIYFNTVLYTGNNTDGNSITGVGFQPDWCWFKMRSSTASHALVDSVRGRSKTLRTDGNDSEFTSSSGTDFKSFDSDGFTVDNVELFGSYNNNGVNIVTWNWKKTATAGFDIVSFTGNDTARTISHSLSAVPNMMILKDRDAGNDWFIYHSANTSAPETDYLKLNSAAATADLNSLWNDTAPTSSVFTIGTNGNINTTGNDYIAYLFSEKKGYSKFGSYTGNGNADGPFVYTGFRPAWVMVKTTTDTGYNWTIYDNKRVGFNPDNDTLTANETRTEQTSGFGHIDIVSNGFKVRASTNDTNRNANVFIYMAFAESPLVNSNGVPTNAR